MTSEHTDEAHAALRAGAAHHGSLYYCWGCGKLVPKDAEEIKTVRGLGPRGYVRGAPDIGIYHAECVPKHREADGV